MPCRFWPLLYSSKYWVPQPQCWDPGSRCIWEIFWNTAESQDRNLWNILIISCCYKLSNFAFRAFSLFLYFVSKLEGFQIQRLFGLKMKLMNLFFLIYSFYYFPELMFAVFVHKIIFHCDQCGKVWEVGARDQGEKYFEKVCDKRFPDQYIVRIIFDFSCTWERTKKVIKIIKLKPLVYKATIWKVIRITELKRIFKLALMTSLTKPPEQIATSKRSTNSKKTF